MKNLTLILRAVMAAFIFFQGTNAFAANIGSPQEVNLKISQLWVSPNTDCTGLTQVYNNASATYQNMVTGPDFGNISVPNGTYTCIAWYMSDVVTLRPDFTSDGGQCVQGTLYTRDLFRPGDTSLSPTGTVINGSGAVASPIEDGMWIYLSTVGDNNNAVTIPSAPGQLNNPLIVGGGGEATMVVDFTNGIEDTGLGGSCSPEGVSFSFRYQ